MIVMAFGGIELGRKRPVRCNCAGMTRCIRCGSSLAGGRRRWRSTGRRDRHQPCDARKGLRRNDRDQQCARHHQRLPGEAHRGGPNPFSGWAVGKCCRLKHGVLLSSRRIDTLLLRMKISGSEPQLRVRRVAGIAVNLHPNRHRDRMKVPAGEGAATAPPTATARSSRGGRTGAAWARRVLWAGPL